MKKWEKEVWSMRKILNNEEFLGTLSNIDKIISIIHDNPNLNYKDISKIYSEKFGGEIKKVKSKVSTTLSRLRKQERVNNINGKYKLTPQVSKYIENELEYWEELQNSDEKFKSSNYDSEKSLLARWEEYLSQGRGRKGASIIDNQRAKNKGKDFFEIDFEQLLNNDFRLAEGLAEDYEKNEEIILGLLNEDYNFDVKYLKVLNVPDSYQVQIGDLRTEHSGKLVKIKAKIKTCGQVRPFEHKTIFECPSCGNLIAKDQELHSSFNYPKRCGCGRKGKFRKVDEREKDSMKLKITELLDNLDRRPEELPVYIFNDLVEESCLKKIGTKAEFTGHIKSIVVRKNNRKTPQKKIVFEPCKVKSLDEHFTNVEISEEEEEKLEKISNKENVPKYLSQQIFPNTFGYDLVKQALILQLAGGVRKEKAESYTRGDIHILLAGDPGTAKTQLLRGSCRVAPKHEYTDGSGVSKVGLTGALVKDNFLDTWVLEAGSLAIASGGLCAINEFDKMENEKMSHLNSAMESQKVKIDKADVHTELLTRTSVLASANPKGGHFESDFFEEINIPDSTKDRFDLIFVFQDQPDEDKDDKIVEKIFKKDETDEVDDTLLKKYFLKCDNEYSPEITKNVVEKIKNYYRNFRKLLVYNNSGKSLINPRSINTLARLSEASAKLRFSNVVEEEDVKLAFKIYKKFVQEISDLKVDQVDTEGVGYSIVSVDGLKEYIRDNPKGNADYIDENCKPEVIEKAVREGEILDLNTEYKVI